MTSVNETSGIPPEKATNEALLGAVSKGDRAAFEELYRRLRGQVYALALSTVRNREDAQDILQDVFTALWQNADEYRGAGSAQSYILSITAKLCKNLLRRRARRADADEEDWLPFLEDSSLSPYQKLLIKECLSSLDEEERQILVLHASAGLKHREIASLLSCSLSAVLSKYNRAVKKLQNKFGKGD